MDAEEEAHEHMSVREGDQTLRNRQAETAEDHLQFLACGLITDG